MIDRYLKQAGQTLADDDSRRTALSRIRRWTGCMASLGSALFLILLTGGLVAMHWIGERNLFTGFLLFLPPLIWIGLPVAAATACLAALQWRWAAAHVAAAGAVALAGLDWQGPATGSAADLDGPFVILTNNHGQAGTQSLQLFKNAAAPDVIALQEMAGQAPRYPREPGYAEFEHVKGAGEFVLLSRHPIDSHQLIFLPFGDRPYPVAARFEIDWHGTRIAVYNVHFPTARDVLASHARGSFLYGILGLPGTSWGERRRTYQAYWDERIRLASAFSETLETEPLPWIAAGDFNAPDRGVIYRAITRGCRDAHEDAGAGFGYTFPGTTRNPLSLGGPWLRIDYILASSRWNVTRCVTEDDRPSQHRAVAAALELSD